MVNDLTPIANRRGNQRFERLISPFGDGYAFIFVPTGPQ